MSLSTGSRFREFISNIQLSDRQISDAITKHTGVRKSLHNAYHQWNFVKAFVPNDQIAIYEQSLARAYKSSTFEPLLDDTYKQRTSLLVGSYGKNTAIAPPSDIDILFEMPSDQFSRYDNYTYNGQSQLLQDVKRMLKKTYPRTDIKADGQIVSVPFLTYNIEVLPAFRKTNGKYLYPDTHGGGSWKVTDPKAEIENIRDANKRSKGNAVKLIKMLKAWKQHCNVPIKSLVLELRVTNFLNSWQYFAESEFYFDWMMRDFFKELVRFANGNCKIPGIEETVHYGDAWLSKSQSALARSEKACDYEGSKNEILATLEWRKIFGDRYPY